MFSENFVTIQNEMCVVKSHFKQNNPNWKGLSILLLVVVIVVSFFVISEASLLNVSTTLWIRPNTLNGEFGQLTDRSLIVLFKLCFIVKGFVYHIYNINFTFINIFLIRFLKFINNNNIFSADIVKHKTVCISIEKY